MPFTIATARRCVAFTASGSASAWAHRRAGWAHRRVGRWHVGAWVHGRVDALSAHWRVDPWAVGTLARWCSGIRRVHRCLACALERRREVPGRGEHTHCQALNDDRVSEGNPIRMGIGIVQVHWRGEVVEKRGSAIFVVWRQNMTVSLRATPGG